MRQDKLTTKFQQTLADAQSLALGADNAYIEPQHLLAAMIDDREAGIGSLLARAGVNVPRLRQMLTESLQRLPKVSGTGGEINVSRELLNLLNLTDKAAMQRGDQFIASELFLVVLTQDKGEAGGVLKEAAASPKAQT